MQLARKKKMKLICKGKYQKSPKANKKKLILRAAMKGQATTSAELKLLRRRRTLRKPGR
jgi:hypothetical protein